MKLPRWLAMTGTKRKGNLDEFSRIAIRHGTDKYGSHLYTPIYNELFAPLRDRRIKLLEIGVGGYGQPLSGGLGLSAWAQFFPNASIYGLDIEEKRFPTDPRIKILRGSQNDRDVLDRIWHEHGPFDIVIDDGSHDPEHVLTSFRCLYPKMSEDGIYVVEDTQTSFWPHLGGRPDGQGTIFELAAQIAIAMHTQEVLAGGGVSLFQEFGLITKAVRTYRNMVVFERGDNDYPSNHSFDSTHPNVVAVRSTIEAEHKNYPSPGAYLTRIDMEMSARQTEAAVALSREAMIRYPARADVLSYVYHVFERCAADQDCLAAAEGLHRMFPEDPWAQHVLAHYREVDRTK